MSDTPFTDRYIADVREAGGAFVRYLPGNTSLGKGVLGAPGARFPEPLNMTGSSMAWRYELAPIAVRLEQGFDAMKDNTAAAVAGTLTQVGDSVTHALGDAAGGALAGLGIPPHVLGAVLIVIGYLMLRELGLVPALGKLAK